MVCSWLYSPLSLEQKLFLFALLFSELLFAPFQLHDKCFFSFSKVHVDNSRYRLREKRNKPMGNMYVKMQCDVGSCVFVSLFGMLTIHKISHVAFLN